MQTATFFSPASAALLRGLLSFADPPALAALEATSGLFGGGAPSLVELAVRDALGAAGLPQGLADARLAGESWARLLRFVLLRVASQQRRHTTSAGFAHSLAVKDGALFSFGWVTVVDWATATQRASRSRSESHHWSRRGW